jgi:hypothetical protein
VVLAGTPVWAPEVVDVVGRMVVEVVDDVVVVEAEVEVPGNGTVKFPPGPEQEPLGSQVIAAEFGGYR